MFLKRLPLSKLISIQIFEVCTFFSLLTKQSIINILVTKLQFLNILALIKLECFTVQLSKMFTCIHAKYYTLAITNRIVLNLFSTKIFIFVSQMFIITDAV